MRHVIGFMVLIIIGSAGYLPANGQDQASSKGLQIADARLGKSLQDRMISDEATAFPLNSRVFVWLKVEGGTGDTLTVAWKHGDKTYTTALGIGGTPWRTWASKTVTASGDWNVSVSDASGTVLKELAFKVE